MMCVTCIMKRQYDYSVFNLILILEFNVSVILGESATVGL